MGPESGDRRVDESRICVGKHVESESATVEGARAERLDQHICRGREIVNLPLTGVAAQVDLDALLAARPEGKGGMLAERSAARRLDPQDLRTEVGEELAHLGADAIR